MRGIRYSGVARTARAWCQDDHNREHVLPGGAKLDAAAFAADASGVKFVPGGTVVGRTYAERAAGAGWGPAADADDEIAITAYDVQNAADDSDVDLLRPGTLIVETWMPTSYGALSAAVKAKVRALYQTTTGQE